VQQRLTIGKPFGSHTVFMLNNYQFTLLIVAVGLAAYLASLYEWHRDKIDDLSTRVMTLEGELSDDNSVVHSEMKRTMEDEKKRVSEKLVHFKLRMKHALVSALLLILNVALLGVRIFLWSWQRHQIPTQSQASLRFLWLDRAIISILTILLLHLCFLHLVGDIPSMWENHWWS
jgi:hypothetical protein